ncbi:MAG TPA: hypothetical protein VK831_00655 [Candidatus Deferrimicrobiaceae bacterium]|nr:hypothetical protein [Candidatus Deferrimicrobiaceae bacterium]
MTSAPRALLAIDAGLATTTVSLLGRPGAQWRLLGSLSAPAVGDPDAIARVLAARIAAADRGLADRIDLVPSAVVDLPRLTSSTPLSRPLVVIGASRRALSRLQSAAVRTPWRVHAASPETHDPREMTELALRPGVETILLGCGDPPGPDERGALDDVAALVGAVARRRPELRIVLAGPVERRRAWSDAIGASDEEPAPAEDGSTTGQRIVRAPPIRLHGGEDDALREVLEDLLPKADVTRHVAVRAAISLADLLNLRLEVLDIGFDGGLRAVASPGVADQGPAGVAVRTASAALAPSEIDDRAVESLLAWTTGSLDRHRMGDRLVDLRTRPWADATGEGARLRLAAARAALTRLAAVTPDLAALPPPDLTIVAGGAFAAAPARAVALAIADTIRRPGATQIALDHARLLGPLGTIEDPDERRSILRDLAADLLAPIGTLVVVAGAVTGRRGSQRVGSLTLAGDGASGPLELHGGEVAFFDLAPGEQAVATFEFRDAIRFGRRARRVTMPVSGGVGGLAVDLRDVPLRLPERRDRRRAALAQWGDLAWPGDER